MVGWKCDICGKDTHIHPPSRPLYDDKEVEVPTPKAVVKDVPIMKDGKPTGKMQQVPQVEIVNEKKIQKVPRMVKVKRQNMHTRAIEEMEVHEHEDLYPRAFIVRLSFGMTEEIQRDFCRECLNKVMPKLKEVWTLLENIKPQ